jgi:hypothetical protein
MNVFIYGSSPFISAMFSKYRTTNATCTLSFLYVLLPYQVRPYVPDFKRGIDHWCIHAGGRAVVDGVGENLKLGERQIEPSRATLYKWVDK